MRRCHGPLTRYAKSRVAHAPGMPGTFSKPPRVSDPDMHHGTCVKHVPCCMPESLTSAFLWFRWRENVPGIPCACATRNLAYLVRGPWRYNDETNRRAVIILYSIQSVQYTLYLLGLFLIQWITLFVWGVDHRAAQYSSMFMKLVTRNHSRTNLPYYMKLLSELASHSSQLCTIALNLPVWQTPSGIYGIEGPSEICTQSAEVRLAVSGAQPLFTWDYLCLLYP